MRPSGPAKVPLLKARECPEGIARRWDLVLDHAALIVTHGWPGRDWTQERKSLIDAVTIVREVMGV